MAEFTEQFRQDLSQLFRWRRDVRRFLPDPVDQDLLQQCLESFTMAPSVGLSEPWRIVKVESKEARASALQNFEIENKIALSGHSGERAELYAGLKLTGMKEAPVQLAIFCDGTTDKGANLGAATMPETRRYSVVAAITQMWLFARSHGLGLGWVSILDAEKLERDLRVPEGWKLVAYLCMGWPEEQTQTPELERSGWETRNASPLIESR